jgi:hypothetical protein
MEVRSKREQGCQRPEFDQNMAETTSFRHGSRELAARTALVLTQADGSAPLIRPHYPDVLSIARLTGPMQ